MTLTKEDVGEAGEKLVFEYFKQTGHEVKRNDDHYDAEKDLVINGKKAEVKTQTIYRKFPVNKGYFPAFTVDIAADSNKIYRNQLNKCMNVERLIFVGRSSTYDQTVRIYEAPPLGKRSFSIIQNKIDKRFVAGFIISDMTEIVAISKPNIVNYFMDEWRQNAASV